MRTTAQKEEEMQKLTYDQTSGHLTDVTNTPVLLGLCYSGREQGLNNPLFEQQIGLGPIPRGSYTLNQEDVPRLGPLVFFLIPAITNQMFGRADFFIHWDTVAADFTASEGYIVCVMPATFHRLQQGATLQVI